MSFNVLVSDGVSASGVSVAGSRSIVCEGLNMLSNEPVQDDATNVEWVIATPATGLKVVAIQSSVDITVTFHDWTGSTQGTVTVLSGKPYIWEEGDTPDPIASTDGVFIKITNDDPGTAGVFTMVVGTDASSPT